MGTRQELIERIRAFTSHEHLLDVFEDLAVGRPVEGWAPGRAFEHVAIRAFELEGAHVEYPFNVPARDGGLAIEQIDGLVECRGITALMEMKDQAASQPVDSIEKLIAKLGRRPRTAIGCVFSLSDFTPPAVILAERYVGAGTVLLWRPDDIRICLQERSFVRGLQEKFRHAVKTGLPDLYLLEVFQDASFDR